MNDFFLEWKHFVPTFLGLQVYTLQVKLNQPEGKVIFLLSEQKHDLGSAKEFLVEFIPVVPKQSCLLSLWLVFVFVSFSPHQLGWRQDNGSRSNQ